MLSARLSELGRWALRSRSLQLAGAVALPLGGVALGVRAAFRRGLPALDGERRLPGLLGDVEIRRDRWGVPHLEADTEADLLFAQGYAHAQDRLFQMEMGRRVAAGTLAEVVGEPGLAADRFFRRVGIARAAAEEEPSLGEAREPIESYVAGVNAYLEERAGNLPPEFLVLRHAPAPWTTLDVLSWAKLIGWTLSLNWDTELLRARILARFGPEGLAALEPGYPAGHPIATSPGERSTYSAAFTCPEYAAARRYLDLVVGPALSNAWAVAGGRSESGRPLLANDPHLAPALPGFWYECHLSGGGLDVAGASVPGAPGIIVGHNRRIAWGVTMALADVQDLYLERLNPRNRREYERAGRWEEGEIRREEIRVHGRSEPVVEEVLLTRHGPVVWPDYGGLGALSVRATTLEPSDLGAVLALDRAESWPEFRAALGRWPIATLSFVYADVDGHIGYALAGRIPIRSRDVGLGPVPGWSDEHEWQGYIPGDEMPAVLDPPDGFVLSANNRIVGDDYPYVISREWSDGYRAARIGDRLEAAARHSVASFAGIQMDRVSLAALEMKPYLLAEPPEDSIAARALDLLRQWSGEVSADSAAAALYEVCRHLLLVNVFGPKLGDLLGPYLGIGHGPMFSTHVYHTRVTSQLLRLLRERPDGWFDRGAVAGSEPRLAVSIGGQRIDVGARRPSAPATSFAAASATAAASGCRAGSAGGRWPRDWDEALRLSRREAIRFLRARLGDEPDAWRWGDLHQLELRHALGGTLAFLNRGPYPIGGDVETVCQAASDPSTPFLANGATASYRQVIDLADWDRSLAVLPSGQSGHPASPHYHDQFALFREGKLHPWPFSRAAVQRATAHRLVLRPGLSGGRRPEGGRRRSG